jgi:RNA polymerase sigma-70 factor, ECF subfamily
MTLEEIAPVVHRSVVATRQLASRARRRVQGQAPTPDADLRAQRRVVDAFLAAAQAGDFEGLVAILHPDIVLRAERRSGESDVASGAWRSGGRGASRRILEDGVVEPGGPGERQRADPDRLSRLDLSALEH